MSMLHLAAPDDLPRIAPMVAAFHAEQGLTTTEADRMAALELLFSGEVQAAAWMIGPRRAPVGYIVIAFGFSIELGGREAFVDEFFLRGAVRGRGMGTQVLQALLPMLREMGVRAVHLETKGNGERVALYKRAGFALRDGYCLMTRVL
ncbi:GNAT family N-acetyltransferase [Actibacterium ureilyticum]|uniref:GNAT family N-acetyltransferase n=1 Tax=Actibacterium ureilyticum TaxID=1590614 RepID=UPI000BAAE140|nr:GNAT family N-acetyltransferase [Actibacterium ureilyticum]